MKEEFPPQSNREAEIEAIVSVFASVIEGRSAYYVSTPMTTGRGSFEPHPALPADRTTNEAWLEPQRDMIHCNHAYIQELVQELRRSLASPVINPTAIADLPGWTQSDYRVLSKRVIECYVHTVIFVEDWQYSLGCSYEFLIARQTGAKTVTQNLQEISIVEGIRLIREATNELQQMSNNTSFLQAVTQELEHCA